MTQPNQTQNYSNHVQKVPAAFSIGALLALANLLWSAWRVVSQPSMDTTVALLSAAALLLALFFARTFALRVQDRVIRLETRLRLAQVLPADLRARIDELTLNQILSLRFASDEELPDLTRRVLTDKVDDRKAIKQMIKHWQGDYLRA